MCKIPLLFLLKFIISLKKKILNTISVIDFMKENFYCGVFNVNKMDI